MNWTATGADNDAAIGGTAGDTLDGGAGNDFLYGGDGADTRAAATATINCSAVRAATL